MMFNFTLRRFGSDGGIDRHCALLLFELIHWVFPSYPSTLLMQLMICINIKLQSRNNFLSGKDKHNKKDNMLLQKSVSLPSYLNNYLETCL